MGIFFSVLAIVAVIAGGVLSIFSARNPTRFSSWTSAFLVIVVGVIQYAFVYLWQILGSPSSSIALYGFIAYDIASACVIIGTALKGRSKRWLTLVRLGGAFFALSMLLLTRAANVTRASWASIWFLALVIIVLIAMPIGLTISARREQKAAKQKESTSKRI